MGYGWKIMKAAVEQVVLFPSVIAFKAYVDGLCRKGEPYEIVSKTEREDGGLTVVIRKRYNQNEFLFSADELLP